MVNTRIIFVLLCLSLLLINGCDFFIVPEGVEVSTITKQIPWLIDGEPCQSTTYPCASKNLLGPFDSFDNLEKAISGSKYVHKQEEEKENSQQKEFEYVGRFLHITDAQVRDDRIYKDKFKNRLLRWDDIIPSTIRNSYVYSFDSLIYASFLIAYGKDQQNNSSDTTQPFVVDGGDLLDISLITELVETMNIRRKIATKYPKMKTYSLGGNHDGLTWGNWPDKVTDTRCLGINKTEFVLGHLLADPVPDRGFGFGSNEIIRNFGLETISNAPLLKEKEKELKNLAKELRDLIDKLEIMRNELKKNPDKKEEYREKKESYNKKLKTYHEELEKYFEANNNKVKNLKSQRPKKYRTENKWTFIQRRMDDIADAAKKRWRIRNELSPEEREWLLTYPLAFRNAIYTTGKGDWVGPECGYYSWVDKNQKDKDNKGAKIRYIVLDTRSRLYKEGDIHEVQLGWFYNELINAYGEKQCVVIFAHHHPEKVIACGQNRTDFLRLLEKFPNIVAYFYGHEHCNEEAYPPGINPKKITDKDKDKEVQRHSCGNFILIQTGSPVDFPQTARKVKICIRKEGSQQKTVVVRWQHVRPKGNMSKEGNLLNAYLKTSLQGAKRDYKREHPSEKIDSIKEDWIEKGKLEDGSFEMEVNFNKERQDLKKLLSSSRMGKINKLRNALDLPSVPKKAQK